MSIDHAEGTVILTGDRSIDLVVCTMGNFELTVRGVDQKEINISRIDTGFAEL